MVAHPRTLAERLPRWVPRGDRKHASEPGPRSWGVSDPCSARRGAATMAAGGYYAHGEHPHPKRSALWLPAARRGRRADRRAAGRPAGCGAGAALASPGVGRAGAPGRAGIARPGRAAEPGEGRVPGPGSPEPRQAGLRDGPRGPALILFLDTSALVKLYVEEP